MKSNDFVRKATKAEILTVILTRTSNSLENVDERVSVKHRAFSKRVSTRKELIGIDERTKTILSTDEN